MSLVVDIGNTRTKWSVVNAEGKLELVNVCANASLASSKLKNAFKGIKKVMIANVAGEEMAELMMTLIPKRVESVFVTSQSKVIGLINNYEPNESLGVDRWLAAIAAWHLKKQPSIIVSAGTAVTIDSISRIKVVKNKESKNKDTRNKLSKQAAFIGGTIMPGLYLMQISLEQNTAKLKDQQDGNLVKFPLNTKDAIATGCVNSVVGAIVLMAKQLEKRSAFLPKIIVTGGDAKKIAEALKFHSKRVMLAENLVLQGLVFFEREGI